MMRTMIDIGEFRERLKTGKQKPQTGVRFVSAQQDVTASDDARTITFVFSDSSVDRYGDTIDARGWILDNYRSNPIALFGHDSGSVENVIGRAHNVRIEGQRLLGDIEFMEAGVNPTAEAVFQMVKGGFLKSVSVGFAPIEWTLTKDKNRPGGVDFKKQELLEISIVPIPANPNALQQAKAAGIDVDRLGLGAPARDGAGLVSKKGLYEVSFLAHILMDLGYLEDMVEWEEDYEGDGSDIAQRLTDALKMLGQILVDMATEEVAEMIGEEDGADPVLLVDDPAILNALTPAQKMLRKLVAITKRARLHSGRRFVLTTDQKITREGADRLRRDFRRWVDDGNSENALILEQGLRLTVIDEPAFGRSFSVSQDVPETLIIDKAGKVLSAANETALRTACDHMTKAMDHVNGVIGAAQSDDGEDAAKAAAEESERELRARARKRRAALHLVVAE